MSEAPARGRRIAILRLTSLGDVIHTLPVAAAIRQHDPNAHIIWLAEEREHVLLQNNPVVDEVVIVPLRRWRAQLHSLMGVRQAAREWREMVRDLRARKIDVALDVQGLPQKTSLLAWLTRAPMRIGFDRPHVRHPAAALFTTVHVAPPPEARHIVDQNLALIGPLGMHQIGAPQFPLPAFPDAERRADEWRRAHGIEAHQRVVVLLPSTRRATKFWPAASFRELARRLLADPAVRIVVLGGPGEDALLAEVRDTLPPDRALAWAPDPIPDLVAIIRHAHLAIGNDTGPLHIAAACQVPAIGLFGPTSGARNGPYGAAGTFIQSATGQMEDISVEEVVAAAGRALTEPAP